MIKKLFKLPALILVMATACCFGYNPAKAQLQAVDTLSNYILTPVPGPEPRINGARIFGVRPGHPILFRVTATGTKPMTFKAKHLPKGVYLDKNTGQFSGKVTKPGRYTIEFAANNSVGKDTRRFTLVVGEEIDLTPPMGWNSWNIYASKVTQALVLANAKAMASSPLIDHGWSYMNIDDVWQGKRGGKFHGILPDSATFPDMQNLVDQIHGLGLKIGIYSSPWVETYGHHIGGSSRNKEGLFTPTPVDVKRNRKLFPYAIGEYKFWKNDVQQWALWGFDYLKYDWNPNELPETKAMYHLLRESGRDILLSLSNSTPFKTIDSLSNYANAWRTGGDIRDNWKSLKSRLLTQDKWAPYARPGHWNDPDMMIVGYVGWGKSPHPSKLTADEQYSHLSAWCLQSVPLLLGCDLTKLDKFTLSLLTNDEVLAVNQDPLGRQATVVSRIDSCGVLAKPLFDGSKAVGLFNSTDGTTRVLSVTWADLGLSGKYIVRDLWRQKDLGVFTDKFSAKVPAHGVVMISIRKAQQ